MQKTIHSEKYKKFIDKLKNARKEAILNQIEVAKKLKKPQSYVSKCESGERRVDILELKEFSNLYGKNIEYFIN